jgi:hypothetical protein
LGLLALLCMGSSPAGADVLRHAALTALLVRENPSAEGRRAALDAAFDAAALRPAEAAPVAGDDRSRRRNWFPKRLSLEAEAARLRMPELPPLPSCEGFVEKAALSLRAALAPWRALADAAWGGSWGGMVSLGLAQDGPRP